MPRRPTHRRATAVLAAAAGAALALVAAAPGAGATAPTPQAELQSVLSAGRAEPSVQVVSSSRQGPDAVQITSVAGRTSGMQEITDRKGGATGHATIVLRGSTVYLKGDVPTLTNYMGFKAADAATAAGRWVAIPSGNADFSTVAGGLTVKSVMQELSAPPSSTLRVLPAGTRHGVAVKAIAMKVDGGTVTLYFRAQGAPLPVALTGTEGATSATVTFSRWGQPVHLVATSPSVPFSSSWLQGS